MRICYSNLACPDWTFEKTVDAVATYGFDGLEVRLFDGEVVTPALSTGSRRRAELALRSNGVEVAALDTSLRVMCEDRNSFLADIEVLSEIAQQWGAPLIRLFGGQLPSEPAARRDALQRGGDLLVEAAPQARGHGVRLAVETHDDFSSAKTVAELLAFAGGSAGAVYDSHHPHRMGERPSDVLADLGPHLSLVQLKDARRLPGEDQWQLVPLGDGEVPVRELLGLLPGAGYDGWASLEFEKKWHPELPAPEQALGPRRLPCGSGWRMPHELRALGFGLAGCGVIAETYAAALADLDEARLVAVTDVIGERAERFAAEHGTADAGSLEKLLATPEVEVVCICAPSGLHAEIGLAVAEAGRHIVVEKPIDISLDAARRLIEAAKARGVSLSVISQQRYNPGVVRAKALLDQGRLGRLLEVWASVPWYRSPAYYQSGAWRGTWAIDGGGAFMNQGVHYADLVCWLCGQPEVVAAQCATLNHEIEVEDVALALLRFENGAVGMLEATTVAYPGFETELRISGTRGTIVLQNGALVAGGLEDLGEHETLARAGALKMPDGHRAQLAEISRAINEGVEPPVGGRTGTAPSSSCWTSTQRRAGRGTPLVTAKEGHGHLAAH